MSPKHRHAHLCLQERDDLESAKQTTATDHELVKAAMRGDRPAFAGLVARYGPAVKAVAFHTLRDHHLAEDAAQEAFVMAHRQLAKLRLPELFGRWILTIARQQALLVRRRQKPQLQLEAVGDLASPVAEENHLLDEVMTLPERERRLVMLRYFNGHSVAEIARITNRPTGTVTKQLSRAYDRLRRRLSEVLT